MSPALQRRTVIALFFFSGLSSLVLETVWVRQMVLVFGSTTFAISTVLTAFMAGLALGSLLAGRLIGRAGRDPRVGLVVYALLELGIGLYALAMPALVAHLPGLHMTLWGSLQESYHAFALVRFALAAALLALPTLAMGATLPVLAHYFEAAGDDAPLGRTVGSLYAVNTAGAVGGVFLAGFVLLPTVGLSVTNLTACLTDLVLAVAAGLLYRSAGPAGPAPTPASPPVATAPGRLALFALVSVGISGALGMVNQVAWTRSLSLTIGSSTYAFSLILLAYLLGLSAGAALYSRRQVGDTDQATNLAVIHLLTGLTCAFGPLVALDRLPLVMFTLLQHLTLSPASVFGLKFALAGAIVFLPTFFMGMVFPAVVQLYAGASRGAAGRVTGTVYAVNTLGAIIGSFSGGFLLVPLIGLRRTLLLAVAGVLLLALLFALAAARRRPRILLAAAAVLLLAGLPLLARPWNLEVLTSGVFRVSSYAEGSPKSARGDTTAPGPAPEEGDEGPGDRAYLTWLEAARDLIPPERAPDSFSEPQSGYRVVRHAEGVTTTVSMGRAVDFSLSSRACWVRTSLLVNGKPDASLSVLHRKPPGGCHTLLDPALPTPLPGALRLSPLGDTETQVLSGLLPYLLYAGEGEPRRALVIGWGSGVTVSAALSPPGIQRLVAAELEGEVMRGARLFEPHNGTARLDPRLKLLEADGRNLLASTDERFDFISSEPSNPWISGCGNLFTREFFRLVKGHLSPDGVFLQWVQAYEISPQNVWSILATISAEFPDVFVFSPASVPTDLLIVARRRAAKVPWDRVARRAALPAVRRLLTPLGIRGPADLAVRLLAPPAGVRAVSQGAPHNTDDNARIEYAAPKDLINFKDYKALSIQRSLESTIKDSTASLFGQVPPTWREALCQAALQAGRLDRIPPPAPGEGKQMVRCRRAAAQLSRPLPPRVDSAWAASALADLPAWERIQQAVARPGERATDTVTALVQPGALTLRQRYALFALLGHLNALANNPFDALAFLLAAEQLTPRAGGPAYPLLNRVLAHQLSRSGLHREALLILDLTR